jgi:hypothetical protein
LSGGAGTPSKLSKVEQQKAVGEGLTAGCLILGHVELPSGKTDVELSFRKAWRSWAHTGTLPAVKVGPDRDDIYHIWPIAHADVGH